MTAEHCQKKLELLLEGIQNSKKKEISSSDLRPFMKNVYDLIKFKDIHSLKLLFSQDFFYKIGKSKIYKLVHLATNSEDSVYRNEIVDFLVKNEQYTAFVASNQKSFPLHKKNN